MTRLAGIAAGLLVAALFAGILLVGGWLLALAGGVQSSCAQPLGSHEVPAELVPLFEQASARYGLDPEGPRILAALTDVESAFGRNLGPSSAGAIGWTQFMPSTWRRFGVDADGNGRRDPMNATDAVFSAANYLRHLGAPGDWRRALFGYNHSASYVDAILAKAKRIGGNSIDVLACDAGLGMRPPVGTRRLASGGRIVPIPGMPGEAIDERILGDVEYLVRRYRVKVVAGYATTGHKPLGEHPLGLAVDLVPGPGGTWDDVDALAAWAEPVQNQPRPPFRWVGYNGDAGHGRGNHLHLSWMHGPDPARRPPAPWVEVFAVAAAP